MCVILKRFHLCSMSCSKCSWVWQIYCHKWRNRRCLWIGGVFADYFEAGSLSCATSRDQGSTERIGHIEPSDRCFWTSFRRRIGWNVVLGQLTYSKEVEIRKNIRLFVSKENFALWKSWMSAKRKKRNISSNQIRNPSTFLMRYVSGMYCFNSRWFLSARNDVRFVNFCVLRKKSVLGAIFILFPFLIVAFISRDFSLWSTSTSTVEKREVDLSCTRESLVDHALSYLVLWQVEYPQFVHAVAAEASATRRVEESHWASDSYRMRTWERFLLSMSASFPFRCCSSFFFWFDCTTNGESFCGTTKRIFSHVEPLWIYAFLFIILAGSVASWTRKNVTTTQRNSLKNIPCKVELLVLQICCNILWILQCALSRSG